MMRVPDFPLKPMALIERLSQFRDGGYVLISHCSTGIGHQNPHDFKALIAQHGDVEVDHAFKLAMICPDCGEPGGGITVLVKRAA